MRRVLAILALVLLLAGPAPAWAGGQVYVILWFDTEDYLLPASDDAALRLADFLSREGVRATFKVVGEKARTLERRGRKDVIAALQKHEIGYHSNYHSVQPTPALYLNPLSWDEGVAEFDRRERPGFEDVKRVFGQAPTCYGQPGSSWGPQSFGAMKQWGMGVYLDSGSHVRLDDKPHYYCGLLTLYRLTHTLRTKLGGEGDLKEAEDKFVQSHRQLLAEGGGVVSIYYHPCEFVHQEFWDGVNFRNGANPPREEWKAPPQKTPEASATAYRTFEDYVRFIKRFPEVRFITAGEAARLYRDGARGRSFTAAEIKAIAGQVGEAIDFQRRDGYTLAPSEIFALLNDFVAARANGQPAEAVTLKDTPLGPTTMSPLLSGPVTTDASQFKRTAADVAEYLSRHGRVPPVVWLGSAGVPPEAYLRTLAKVATTLADSQPLPAQITVEPASVATLKYVAEDGPNLWGWVIFPRGVKAPTLMQLARRQAWTIKPAVLGQLE